jgi:hypothetical protein
MCTIADIQHLVIYLNAFLYLWKRNPRGNYEEVDALATPASLNPYVLRKTLIHKQVELEIIWGALCHKDISWHAMDLVMEKLTHDLHQLAHALHLTESKANSPSIDVIHTTLDAILQTKSCNNLDDIHTLKEKYVEEMKPVVKQYSKEVSKMQLDGINDIMQLWASNHRLNLLSAHAIIVGAKGPRKGMIEVQYFEHRYKQHQKMPTDYIHYIESPTDCMPEMKIPQLINEWARHCLNQRIGKERGNINMMNEDILSEYALEVLEEQDGTGRLMCSCYRLVRLNSLCSRETLMSFDFQG